MSQASATSKAKELVWLLGYHEAKAFVAGLIERSKGEKRARWTAVDRAMKQPKAKESGVDAYWAKIDALIAAGKLPTITSPEGFSAWLCALMADPSLPDLVGEQFWSITSRKGNYKPMLRRFFETYYPEGIQLYRGLHNLKDGLDAEALFELATAHHLFSAAEGWSENEEVNFSQNVAKVVRDFTQPYGSGNWALGRKAKLDWNRRGQAGTTGVLLVARPALDQILGWGADSESHILDEAEVKLSHRCYPACVAEAYAISKTPIRGAGFATAKEIASYTLDKAFVMELADEFNKSREVHEVLQTKLHPKAHCGKGKVKANTPPGFRWYRIR
jgi:hypothetical protein